MKVLLRLPVHHVRHADIVIPTHLLVHEQLYHGPKPDGHEGHNGARGDRCKEPEQDQDQVVVVGVVELIVIEGQNSFMTIAFLKFFNMKVLIFLFLSYF